MPSTAPVHTAAASTAAATDAAHSLTVAVPTPAHSSLGDLLSYTHSQPLPPGTLVRVPLGRRETLGIVWDGAAPAFPDAFEVRPIAAVLEGLTPLSAGWRQLVAFCAKYYQRSLGEVALAALPPQLRELQNTQLARRLQRQPAAAPAPESTPDPTPDPTPEQSAALTRIAAGHGTFLLFGATGSGKTEVYLRAVEDLLRREPEAQALVMVPEINLTPQLQARFEARFSHRFGPQAVAAMHSGMTNPQRLASWLAAHQGGARIVLGTRLAIFASLPRLRLIIADEEHDPSYKQQEGARYSARDLAIWRGHAEGAAVVLGSATPSLESWRHSRPPGSEGTDDPGGRYVRLAMPARIGAGAQPRLRLVNMQQQPRKTLFAPPLLAAMQERIARGEQALVLLNRRGYAPVQYCADCSWKSDCPYCSAHQVFHKADRTLRCHHCGFTQAVPRACPSCGNPDIAPLGRGTEQIEERLAELLAASPRPDGSPVRIGRIDADSTRAKGALQSQLAAVHDGSVDILVGTQMIAKGHDFRRISLVVAVNADAALFSSDFRAPERLFALLLQAGGRAGRDAQFMASQGSQAELWVQTHHPEHPLFAALRQHDYPAFAAQQLAERAAAAMPPYAFQALVRAEARSQAIAQGFLQAAAAHAEGLPGAEQVTCYPAVPMAMQRVATIERAQMLIESPSRAALQSFLAAWQEVLHRLRQSPAGKGLVRWAVDVDPLQI